MHSKIEIRGDGQNFDLEFPDYLNDTYVDGAAVFMIAPSISKIGFFASQGVSETAVERRVVNTRLAIPTLALLELIEQTIEKLPAMSSELFSANEENNKKITAIVHKLTQLPKP